jgi:hypothetical protein
VAVCPVFCTHNWQGEAQEAEQKAEARSAKAVAELDKVTKEKLQLVVDQRRTARLFLLRISFFVWLLPSHSKLPAWAWTRTVGCDRHHA